MNGKGTTRKAMAGLGLCLAVMVAAMPICAHETAPDRWRITPGEGIGQVKLGTKRQALHALLGAPQSQESRQQGALVVERWAGKKLSAKSAKLNFKTDFLTVYYKSGRVVQVDASSPAFKLQNGLSTQNSAQEFHARYQGAFKQTDRRYSHRDPGGIPAGKHFVRYEDDIKQGVALRYGWWGNLAPEADPSLPLETISVHRPGQTVLQDPDGADQFTITTAYVQKHGYPARKAGVPQ